MRWLAGCLLAGCITDSSQTMVVSFSDAHMHTLARSQPPTQYTRIRACAHTNTHAHRVCVSLSLSVSHTHTHTHTHTHRGCFFPWPQLWLARRRILGLPAGKELYLRSVKAAEAIWTDVPEGSLWETRDCHPSEQRAGYFCTVLTLWGMCAIGLCSAPAAPAGLVVLLSCPLVKKHADLFGPFLY